MKHEQSNQDAGPRETLLNSDKGWLSIFWTAYNFCS